MNRRALLFTLMLGVATPVGRAFVSDQESPVSVHDRGMMLVGRGRIAEAEVVLRRSLTIDETASRSDADGQVRRLATLDFLACVAHARGDDAEAGALLRRAVELAEARPKLAGTEAASIFSSLARLLLTRGATDDAKRLATRSLALYEKARGASRAERADALATLAMVAVSDGDLVKAQALLRRARRVVEIENARPALQAMVLGHLGALRLAEGRYPEAETLLEQALELGGQVTGPDHPALVPMMQALAECYRLRARTTEADALFERALRIASAAYGAQSAAIIVH